MIKEILRPYYRRARPLVKRLRSPGASRVFVISIQRTGTTSTGQFLEKVGYPTAGWPVTHKNDWGMHAFNGNYDRIFKSLDFRLHQAFEDGPWFHPHMYRIVFHKFPRSKFILLERDPEDWFKSMLSHSRGLTLGATYRHCEFYRREGEYNERIDAGESVPLENGLELDGHKDHYIKLYNIYNRKAKDFFLEHGRNRLFIGRLEDARKWEKIATFLGAKYTGGDIHLNRSKKTNS